VKLCPKAQRDNRTDSNAVIAVVISKRKFFTSISFLDGAPSLLTLGSEETSPELALVFVA
jgi:hypothetical protein